MSELREYTFRTKTGICILTHEKLVLKREGTRGKIAQLVYGNSIRRALAVYVGIGTAAMAIGVWAFVNVRFIEGFFFFTLGVICIVNVIVSRNNSTTNTIEHSTVQRVVVKLPHPPFTRGVLVVHFMDNGQKRKRMIALPGSMSDGKEEFKRALLVMRETGWYNN
jgi:chloramphenicol 3-O-phosphotransferase